MGSLTSWPVFVQQHRLRQRASNTILSEFGSRDVESVREFMPLNGPKGPVHLAMGGKFGYLHRLFDGPRGRR